MLGNLPIVNAQENNDNPNNAAGVSYRIQLYNLKLYSPQSAIQIRHIISNEGAQPFLFRLADDRVFNIHIEMQTEGGIQLEESPTLVIRRSQNSPVLYREIALAPGEEYSFIEPLRDYILIEEPGNYIARAQFFPTLLRLDSSEDSLSSLEPLRIAVRPTTRSSEKPTATTLTPTSTPLLRQNIPPDQVVRYLLDARIDEDWERFFLYLNLTSIYRALPSRDRLFIRLSARNQLLEIEKFRQDLQRNSTDDGIALRPLSYRILETSYNDNQAQVEVDLTFRQTIRGSPIRRYRYFLRRDNNSWEVYDYSVTILSTTPN